MKKLASYIFKDTAFDNLGSIRDLKEELDRFNKENPDEEFIYFEDPIEAGGGKLSIVGRNERGNIERIQAYENSGRINYVSYSKFNEEKGEYQPCVPEDVMKDSFEPAYKEVVINHSLEEKGRVIYIEKESKSEMEKAFEEAALNNFQFYKDFRRHERTAREKNGRKLSQEDISSLEKLLDFRE